LEDTSYIPSLRHMRVFESVARLHSVSRATSAVNLSQPAISQGTANLEERFGVQLLERHHAGSLPTEYGEILLFRIHRMHLLMLQAIQEFVARSAGGHKFDAETTLRKITLAQIRSLIAMSESVSFDQASRSIGISPPSLHKAARDLEELLHAPLYARGGRGITTTQQGSVLARRFNVALGEIRHAREEIDHRKGVVNMSVLIGTLSTSGAPLLSRAIDTLLANYPGLKVNVIEEPYEHLLNDLVLGDIDFLFSVLRRPEWATEVVEETLYQDDYVVVSRPGHPLNRTAGLSLNDLARYKWIIPGPTTPRFLAFQNLFAKHRAPNTEIVTASRAITRALIAGSDRLTLLTRQEALSESSLGVMAVLPFACKMAAPAYGVATRMGWAPTTMQQRFLDILRRLAAENKASPERAPQRRARQHKTTAREARR